MERRRRFELSPPALGACAALFLALFANVSFWKLILATHPAGDPRTWLLAASTVALLASVHFLLIAPFTWRRLLQPFLTLLFVATAAAVYYMNRFNVIFDASMMRNVFQTDVREASELINASLFATVVLLGVLPAGLFWAVRLKREPLGAAFRRRAVYVAAAVILLLGSTLVSYKSYASFFRNHREARFMVPPLSFIASGIGVGIESLQGPEGPRIPVGEDATLGPSWNGASRPVLFVIVVGETARAAAFSLNGYARDTDPNLRQDDVINFPHVDACATSTADSLPCMFSSFARDDFSAAKGRGYESLLDVVSHAGFRVVWRDNNSGCKHVCDGVITQLLDKEQIEGVCTDGECFDEVLFKDWDQLLADRERNMLLVLHQKGSHGPSYYKRYPKAFERFTPTCTSENFDDCTPQEIRNAYDNTILYTDYILGQTIERLAAARAWDTAMLYVSDHGESLGEHGLYLHGVPFALAPDAQKHVPMMLWMSSGFASRFDLDPRELAVHAKLPLSHDNLFHSVLGLLDIRTRVYDRRLDFAHEPGHQIAAQRK